MTKESTGDHSVIISHDIWAMIQKSANGRHPGGWIRERLPLLTNVSIDELAELARGRMPQRAVVAAPVMNLIAEIELNIGKNYRWMVSSSGDAEVARNTEVSYVANICSHDGFTESYKCHDTTLEGALRGALQAFNYAHCVKD